MTANSSSDFQTKLMELQGNMFNFAMMLTSNRDDAHDLVQDTTLKALDSQAKYSENTNFKGWVLTIMRNIFINNYKRGPQASTVIDQTQDLIHLNICQESGFGHPESSYGALEIRSAIDHFEEKLRLPFTLFVDGFKYDEIAEQLGLPMGTVKTRIFTARQMLQARFADYR